MGLDMYLVKRPKVKDEEVCYWQKANVIHNWFVRNVKPVGNCEECVFGKETLEALMKNCEAVLRSGVFGNTDYDQNYLDQIQYTYDKCKEVLETTDFEKYNLVYSAWW